MEEWEASKKNPWMPPSMRGHSPVALPPEESLAQVERVGANVPTPPYKAPDSSADACQMPGWTGGFEWPEPPSINMNNF